MPHVDPQDLKRYAQGQLSGVEFEVVQVHLVECESCQHDLAKALADQVWSGEERRSEPRTAVDRLASIKVLDPIISTSPPQQGRALEVSASGMRIRVQRLMFPRALIQVRIQDKIVLGVVKYCIQDGDEYQIGVRIVKDFPS